MLEYHDIMKASKPELSVNYINLNHVNYLQCDSETRSILFVFDYSVKIHGKLVADIITQTYLNTKEFNEKLSEILITAKVYNYYKLSHNSIDYFVNRDKITSLKTIKQNRNYKLFVNFSNCIEFENNIIPDFITFDFNSENKLKSVMNDLIEIKTQIQTEL